MLRPSTFKPVCFFLRSFPRRASRVACSACSTAMDVAGHSPMNDGVTGGHQKRVRCTIDVCLRPNSTARAEAVEEAVLGFVERRAGIEYVVRPLELPAAEEDPFLHAHVESAAVCELGASSRRLDWSNPMAPVV